jgi:hypothetical protein
VAGSGPADPAFLVAASWRRAASAFIWAAVTFCGAALAFGTAACASAASSSSRSFFFVRASWRFFSASSFFPWTCDQVFATGEQPLLRGHFVLSEFLFLRVPFIVVWLIKD